MKNLFCLFLIISSSFRIHAQDEEPIRSTYEVYEVNLPLLALECTDVNCDNMPAAPTKILLDKGVRFYILERLSTGDVIVQLLFAEKFYKSSLVTKAILGKGVDIKKVERTTYKILIKDFNTKVKRRYSTGFLRKDPLSGTSITGGVALLPLKFRPKVKVNGEKFGFDFSKDIQLGLSGGLKQRISHYNPYFINALFNIGISSVTMDKFNTMNTLDNNIDIAALTFSYGLVLDFTRIQLGIFAGRDFVSDRNRNNWIYHGKTWFSVGFGYSIFSVSTKSIGASSN